MPMDPIKRKILALVVIVLAMLLLVALSFVFRAKMALFFRGLV